MCASPHHTPSITVTEKEALASQILINYQHVSIEGLWPHACSESSDGWILITWSLSGQKPVHLHTYPSITFSAQEPVKGQ